MRTPTAQHCKNWFQHVQVTNAEPVPEHAPQLCASSLSNAEGKADEEKDEIDEQLRQLDDEMDKMDGDLVRRGLGRACA